MTPEQLKADREERLKYYFFAYDYPPQKAPAATLWRCFAWALNDEQCYGSGAQFWNRMLEDIEWLHSPPIKVDPHHINLYRSNWEACEPIKCSLI